MARLYLFAEGQTEQTFADDVLKPHLANYGVYLHKPVLIAHARKKGRVHRGGGRNYVAMKNDIVRFLAQDKADDAYFTTMIDLYAIHSEFPGLEESEKLRYSPTERVEFLEQAFSDDVGDRRFVPYLQMHEFEAMLFAGPSKFEYFYDHHQKQIEALKAIAKEYSTPELIDDGQHSAPSKRIVAQLSDYEDAKSVVGPGVVERIGLKVIRSKCLHFAKWLTRLESLGNP